MDSAGAVAILVIVLSVVMIGMFMTVWSRDQKRSQKVADNKERLHTDTTSDNGPSRPTPGRETP